jgi:hypothetical protein
MDGIELRRIMSNKRRVELRFLVLKTEDLKHYINEQITKEIIVYTYQLIITGILKLPNAKVAFFAAEIIKRDGAVIQLSSNTINREAAVKVEHRKLLCSNKYDVKSRQPINGTVLNIYTTKSSVPFTCSANFNEKDIVIQATITSKGNAKKYSLDASLLSIILDCAKVVAQQNTYAKDKLLLSGSLPVRLIQFVLDETRGAKEDGTRITDSMHTLRLNARNLIEDLTLRANGIRQVPYLSLRAHGKILALLKDDAKLAISEFSTFERISQDFKSRIESADNFMVQMTTIVRHNDLDIDAFKQQLLDAKKAADKMKKKFVQAKAALETAKNKFEEGVREYKKKSIANVVFSIIGGITSVFAGGLTGTLGLTLEISELGDSATKLHKSLYKLAIIMEALAGISDSVSTFAELKLDILPNAQSGASDYYSATLPEEKDHSLAVMIKEWDVFDATAEAFLGMGTPANDISGTSDYLAALKTVAVWGRGYHEKSITIQQLMATLVNKKILQTEHHQAQNYIKSSRDAAWKDQEINGELLIQMSVQKQLLRNIMVDKLMSFCDSYFYNWLSECTVIPKMDDDLYALHGKINSGLRSVINAVRKVAPFVPQAFEKTIVIKD